MCALSSRLTVLFSLSLYVCVCGPTATAKLNRYLEEKNVSHTHNESENSIRFVSGRYHLPPILPLMVVVCSVAGECCVW